MIPYLEYNFAFLFTMENITLILIFVPLIFFLWISVHSKNIKSYHFQIFVFILLYFIGGILENNVFRNYLFSYIPSDLGSQIHVIAAIFFMLIVILRFYNAKQKNKEIMDDSKLRDY